MKRDFALKLCFALFCLIALGGIVSAATLTVTPQSHPYDLINYAGAAYFGQDANSIVLHGRDFSADQNYIVRLGFRGVFTDVNVIDANIGAGEVLDGVLGADGNYIQPGTGGIFDVNVLIPANYAYKGQQISIGVWTVSTAAAHPKQVTGFVADVNFILGPYLALNKIANSVDQNITIIGFGFTPDSNVILRYQDLNGAIHDMNTIIDVNYGPNKGAAGQLSGSNITINHSFGDKVFRRGADWAWQEGKTDMNGTPSNGFLITTDANGNFDVNAKMPWTVSMAGPPGSTGPMNYIDANALAAYNATGDTNSAYAMVAVMPSITMGDENVTVLICDRDTNSHSCFSHESSTTKHRLSMQDAMMNNYIGDTGHVRGFMVEIPKADGNVAVRVEFNSDMNAARGPTRDYGSNMDAGPGKANINSSAMPEFAMDANITFFNIKVPSSLMPIIARDGRICPQGFCKNRDGTTLSPTGTFYDHTGTQHSTWEYNSVTGDGNLFFRVSSFSSYSTLDMNAVFVSPAGGEKARAINGNGTDTNTFRISFQFKSNNPAESRIDANIYYSDVNGDADTHIVTDWNILDTGSPIICTDSDSNLMSFNTCYYDWNITGITGAYFIDINLTQADGNWFLLTHDANFKVNPPMSEITDANMLTESTTYWDLKSTADGEIYTIDFNILVPDGNAVVTLNRGDFNVSLWYSTTANTKTNFIFSDANVIDGTGINCDLNLHTLDANCTYDWNYASVAEGNYYLVVDVNNGLINGSNDLNSSPSAIAINDTNAPDLAVDGNGSSQSTSGLGVSYSGNDATSGIKQYWVRLSSQDNWTNNGTNASYNFGTVSNGTYIISVKAQDYADNNSEDFNITKVVQAGGGSAPVICGDGSCNGTETCSTCSTDCGECSGGSPGGGPSGGSTPGKEEGLPEGKIVYQVSISNKPTAEQLAEHLREVGASENAIQKASAAVGKTNVERTLYVIETKNPAGILVYRTFIVMQVTNPGNKKIKNVKIIERIPKSVANSASEIDSNFAFTILKDDPILEFTIDELASNDSAKVSYTVNKRVTAEMAADFASAPIVSELLEELCVGVTCDDSNPCTMDKCVSSTGKCSHTNEADGTSCATDATCKAGNCTTVPPVEPPYVPPVQPPAQDNSGLIIGIIVVLIVIGGGAYYYTNYTKQKKGKK
ncbi:MAG: hypothetical protein V1494_05485 [Candidatus Diapherotrites archaeon]